MTDGAAKAGKDWRNTQLLFKRLFDLAASICLGAMLSPILCAIALWIVLTDGGPGLYVQERVGRDGKPFPIRKSRTMIANAENMGLGVFTEADDPRITRIGRFLRRFSLDELPQQWNNVRGEMRLVGPRLLLP